MARIHERYNQFFDLFDSGKSKAQIAKTMCVSVSALESAWPDLDWGKRKPKPMFENKNPDKTLKKKHQQKLDAAQARRDRYAAEEVGSQESVDIAPMLRDMSTEALIEMKEAMDTDPDYEDDNGVYAFVSQLIDEREREEEGIVVAESKGARLITEEIKEAVT